MPLFYLNHLSQVLTEGEEWSPLLRQRPLFGGGAGAFLPRGASAAAINRALSEPTPVGRLACRQWPKYDCVMDLLRRYKYTAECVKSLKKQ